MTIPAESPTHAHLVGSINLPDADTTFRHVSAHLGAHVTRIPDGEVGERFYWIQFQRNRFDGVDGLVRVGDTPIPFREIFDARPLALAPGFDATELRFPSLGYADAAIASYADFARLKADGVIPEHVRFQVSLPTPAGVVGSFIVSGSQAAVEPEYEKALFAELERILAAIPHDQLAIQWDTAYEFGMLEGAVIGTTALTSWFADTHEGILEGVIDRGVRQAAAVPIGVELGYHLCYGDVEETHFIEPEDASTLAEVLTGFFVEAPRVISFVHLPVPIERDDDAFFAPLGAVAWPEATEVFLGLIHHEDGVEGALRRAATASRVVPRFGVATECGFGRGPSERTDLLLDLHNEVAAAL